MAERMTRRRARYYIKAFDHITKAETRELRRSTPAKKLIQHVALMGLSYLLPKRQDSEIIQIRRRWNILQEKLVG